MTKIDLGLPLRDFLYTLDQIADLTNTPMKYLREKHIYFDGISTGTVTRDRMVARNISNPDTGDRPDWRVSEEEFKRWLRHKGFRVYDTSRLKL